MDLNKHVIIYNSQIHRNNNHNGVSEINTQEYIKLNTSPITMQ